MEAQLSPLFGRLLGSQGQALLRKSTDALKNLWAKNRTALLVAGAVGVGAAYYNSSKKEDRSARPAPNPNAPKKPAVDALFWRRIRHLLGIVVPSAKSIEVVYIALLTILLLARTVLSIRVAEVMGSNASSLVEMNKDKFIRGVLALGLIAIPASIVNSLLKFFTSMLAIGFRKRLSKHVHEKYMNDLTFYKAADDERIDNIDQRITQDIERFTAEVSSLYATTFKPVVDIILFTRKLTNSVGVQGPIMMYLYYFLSGFFLRRLLPNFARMTAKSQQLEGNFRFHHSRLLMHAEEIAFYRGWEREKVMVNDSFNRLYSHSSNLFWKQALVGVFDAWLVKYGATMVGYGVVALPVFGGVSAPDHPGMSAADITKGYIRNTQVLINLAQATGQIVLLYKRITQLAGYTTRVSELLELFDATEKKSIESSAKSISSNDNALQFEHVSIDTPDGDIPLVRDLSMKIEPQMHTLIMGPNGSGKSSIFRVLSRMWSPKEGQVSRPLEKGAVMFVPQRPYFPQGSLREQVIYPDELSDMRRKGVTDEDLRQLLADAELAYLIEREGGFDAVKDWVDVLSGGEKQRMGMARMFYHKPKFALLDECTSAVSVDVEGRLYRKCQEYGVTIVTISHRKQLLPYHNYLLKFGDNQQCTFTRTSEAVEQR